MHRAGCLLFLLSLGCGRIGFALLDEDSSSNANSADATASLPVVLVSLDSFDTCKATLLVSLELLAPIRPNVWTSTGQTVPPGTPFLLAESFNKWQGYVLTATDSFRLSKSEDLLPGIDFSTSCPTAIVPNFNSKVLLEESTFFAASDLSSAPCVLPRGTTFFSFSFRSGDIAEVSSDTLLDGCGFSDAFSQDIVYGNLVPIPVP